MKLSKVTIQNIKSYSDKQEVLFQGGLNVIIGPNSGGKSNTLEIIQSVFNDVLFESIRFQKGDNKTPPIKPFKSLLQDRNNNHLNQLFDKHISNNELPQEIILSLSVEDQDISNLRAFESVSKELKEFENEKVGSNHISNLNSKIDHALNFEELSGQTIDIVFNPPGAIVPTEKSELVSQFFIFLQWSRVIFQFSHFYSQYNQGFGTIIRPYFYYISPTREFNMGTNESIVDLVSPENSSANILTQQTQTQDARLNNFGTLNRVLVENHYSGIDGGKEFNKEFGKKLTEYLQLDYLIEQHGLHSSNQFKITYNRTDPTRSWKLSSGEREFFNLLCTVFAYSIEAGVLVIDEPELHLHPKWQKKFTNLLRRLSTEKNIQIILVTHSGSIIDKENLNNLVRVTMLNGASKVFLPNQGIVENQTTKDQFMLVTASNNERIFFADKVILVEGVTDRIIVNAIALTLKDEEKQPIIEIVEVYSKHNFSKYREFLKIWNIPTYIIADLDYLSKVDSDSYNKVFEPSPAKVLDKISEKSSKDGQFLLSILEEICSQPKNYEQKIDGAGRQKLCELFQYLKSKHQKRKSDKEENIIEGIINPLREDGIYLLSKGDIEDYFDSIKKFDIDTSIKVSEEILQKKIEVDSELIDIIESILSD